MRKGFTLVELAIVITIIGLLIGGVLKGQELLQNTRMTSSAAKVKSVQAAVITFKDIYKALPGDIASPGNFLQNCTTAPCNVSGDRNDLVGIPNNLSNNESQNFWLHLAKAGLMSGIDPNSTWTGSNYYTASMPVFDLAGKFGVYNCVNGGYYTYDEGLSGHCFYPMAPTSDGSGYNPIMPANLVAKYDLKVDDGKAFAGDVRIWSPCGIAFNANYDPNLSAVCYMIHRAGF